MAATLQEYLVSLGAEVDEKGIKKIHQALSSTKAAALGVASALVAVVGAIAKTSVSLDETSRKYEQMARAQHKSTEEIRAQETALKAMGKTLQEVKADKVLNAQYQALLKVGKGLALPEASGGTLVLRGIIGTLEELKVKGTYALQWINYHLLNKLYYPLSRLRSGLQNFSMKLSANFPAWTEKIATGLSYIVRLVGAGVEGTADLLGWINQLPDGIKLVGEAIAVAFGASKLGTVGLTIASIAGLLLLLEDFYTWKNGTGPTRLGDFWQAISDGTLISPEGIQNFLNNLDEMFGSVQEKVGQFLDIGTDITGQITAGIESFDAEGAGKTLAAFLGKIVLGIEKVLNGNDTRFYDFAASALTLVTTLCGKATDALGTFLGSAEWGAMLEGALTLGGNFISGVFDLLLGKEGAEGTEAQQGLVDTLTLMLQNVVSGLGDGLKKISFTGLGEKTGAFITELFSKIGDFFKKEGGEDAPIKQLLGKGIEVIKTTLTGIVDFFTSTLSSINYTEVKESIGSAVNTILGWISSAISGKETGVLAIGKDISDKITAGIASFDASTAGETLAGFVEKIVNGILGVVDGSNTQFFDFAKSALGVVTTLFEKISETIGTFLASTEWGTMLEGAFTAAGSFLGNVVDLVLGKEGAEGTDAEQGLARTIIGILQNVVNGLGDGLKKISFEGLGEKTGAFITELFERIGGFFQKEGGADAPIVQLIGTGIEVVKSAMRGIMEFLLSALSSISFSEVGGSINSAITTVLGWVLTALNGAVDLILGGEETEGLAGSLLEFLRIALQAFGDMIGEIDFSQIGTQVGTFVSGLFGKLGDFFSREAEKAKNGESLVGSFVSAIGKILAGFGEYLASAWDSIDTKDITDFANGIWEAIKGAIEDVGKRLKSGEIDLEGICTNIGSALGKAIRVGVEFLAQLLVDIDSWLWDDGGISTLLEFGETIGNAIASGIAAAFLEVLDPIGSLVFGEEGWEEEKSIALGQKQEMEKKKKQREVEAQAKIYEQYEAAARERWENDPEVQKVFADPMTYALYYTDDKYWQKEAGGTYADWWSYWNSRNKGLSGEDLYSDMFSSMYNFNPDLANSALWITPSDLHNKVNGMDFEQMYRMQSWILNGLGSYGVTADWLFDRNTAEPEEQPPATPSRTGTPRRNRTPIGTATEDSMQVHGPALDGNKNADGSDKAILEVDNSQAQEAIKETEESLDGIDGTKAETTIITNHVDTYTQTGGGGTNQEEKQAFGGRFDRPTKGEFGEDGTEYIIPITKPSRARSLILQMFREMGSRANSILEDLGVPVNEGSIGGPGQPYYRQSAGMYPAAGGTGSVKNNSDNTVSAPTNIYVYGSSDPERTGREAARASGNNIVRRVRGCFEG